MYHKDIYRSRSVGGAPAPVRPDLRAAAVRDWALIPVDATYVWQQIGPAQGIPTASAITSSAGLPDGESLPVSGLVSDIAVAPSNSANVVIGTRNGGIWSTSSYVQAVTSTPDPVAWTALTDGMPSLQTVTVSMVETSGAPILVAGTGELTNTQLRNAGLAGLYRSVDGGRSWSIADGGPDATIFQSNDINQVIAIDADRMFVATRVGLFYSKNGGRNFGTAPDFVDGLPILNGFVSSVAREGNEIAAAVAGEPTEHIDPLPPEIVALALPSNAIFGIYTSTLSPDPGSFRLQHRTLARVSDPAVGQILLARRGNLWLMSVAPGVALREANEPAVRHHSVQFTRRDITNPDDWGSLDVAFVGNSRQSSYSHAIGLEVPPRAVPPFLAWFGTLALFRQRIDLDGGGHWAWTSDPPLFADVHADQHVVRTPDRGHHVIAGNDGGLFGTSDPNGDWSAHNAHNTTLFWSLSVAQGASASELKIVAGLQDNGTIFGEGPADTDDPTSWHWRWISDGDGGNAAFVPGIDPSTAFVTLNGFILAAERTGDIDHWSVTDVEGVLGGSSWPTRFPFSETVAMARSGTAFDRLYFGRSETRNGPGKLFRRDGHGSLDQIYPRDNTGAPRDTDPTEPAITAIATAPADPSTERSSPGEWRQLWIGFSDGGLLFSPDAGDTYVRHPTGGIGPVTGIAIDPNDSRRIVVVHAGFSEPSRSQPSRHVFLSEDGGVTFRDISGLRNTTNGFVPDVPVLGVTFTRTNPAMILIATDVGVLATTGPSYGATWKRLGVGLPKVPCTAIGVVNPPASVDTPDLNNGLPPVAIGTWGRGAWLLRKLRVAQAYVEFDGGFGPVAVGSTARRRLTLYNVGNVALRVAACDAPAPFSVSTPPADPIQPGGSVSWDVSCAPTSAGISSGDIRLTLDPASTQAASNLSVSCEGVSVGRPRLAMWPREIPFGDVPDGTTVTETVHLENRGATTLNITNVISDPITSARFQIDLVPGTIAPGASLPVTVRYAASGVGTSAEGKWTIGCDDPTSYPVRRIIHATATTVATTVAQPPHTGFPSWGWWIVAGAALVGAGVGILLWEHYEDQPHS